jgi:hypothetical protein
MSLFHFRKGKAARASNEETVSVGRRYELKPGRCYVVEETPPDVSFDAFSNLVSTSGGGAAGLAVTRQHPDLVRQKYGLQKTPIYWLATRAGEGVISPTNLGILTQTMVKFIAENDDAVILLDGLEYLVSNNDFGKVLKVIDQVHDHVSQSGSRLILPVDPRAFEPRELALLERNMDRIAGPQPEY